METHRTVDLLPDREADTFAAWLKAHPGVQIICRDRAGAYAAGAREGAPEAQQVADRFHLWKSLGEAIEKTVITHRADLREPEIEPEAKVAEDRTEDSVPAEPTAPLGEPDGFHDIYGQERRLVARHRERYTAVHALLAEGLSLSAIGRDLGLNRHTVGRFARATSIDQVLFKSTNRVGVLDEFKPYLNQRWNEGATNAVALHAELQARGWKGGVQAVRRYLHQFRGETPSPFRPDNAHAGPALSAAGPVKPRHLVRWIMTRPDHLTSSDAARLANILDRSPELAATSAHVRSFATMMTERQGHRLDQWLTDVRADPLPALHSFANGLQRDHDAVLAGLTLPYSSGAVEGRVCKLKFLKRVMYGRANFDLLRAMALHN
jgi:transposase